MENNLYYGSYMMTLSIVFPLYNEEQRLHKTIEALCRLQLPYGIKLKEVIFVNDGSTDKTESRIMNYELRIKKKFLIPDSCFMIRLISYPNNMGKGYAVKQGMLSSTADYTFFVDADMSTPLSELHKFLIFMEKGVDVIIGTRKNGKATIVKKQPFYRQLLGRGFTYLANVMLHATVSDHTCGFKGFSLRAKETIFPRAHIKRWAYDAEVLHLVGKFGLSLHEVPVTWTNDRQSKVSLLTDVASCLRDLIAIRLYDLTGRYTFAPSWKTISTMSHLAS